MHPLKNWTTLAARGRCRDYRCDLHRFYKLNLVLMTSNFNVTANFFDLGSVLFWEKESLKCPQYWVIQIEGFLTHHVGFISNFFNSLTQYLMTILMKYSLFQIFFTKAPSGIHFQNHYFLTVFTRICFLFMHGNAKLDFDGWYGVNKELTSSTVASLI